MKILVLRMVSGNALYNCYTNNIQYSSDKTIDLEDQSLYMYSQSML